MKRNQRKTDRVLSDLAVEADREGVAEATEVVVDDVNTTTNIDFSATG